MRRRGLTLDRLRQRLLLQGIRISLSTLSYWQNGRSQPERPDSLRAVDALESILELPRSSLRSLLGPHRPRGRAPQQDKSALSLLLTTNESSPMARALGSDFADVNSGIHQMINDTTLRLNEKRGMAVMSQRHVIRASREGVRAMTVVQVDEESAAAPPEITVTCGRLGRMRYLPELRTTVFDVLFGHPLARNETAVVAYDFRASDTGTPCSFFQQNVRKGLRESLLQVVFHPGALPLTAESYRRSSYEGQRTHVRSATLDASYSVHVLNTRMPSGYQGICWRWSD
ncbi:XRE family transcriptional regulator [Streptomyces sp. McG3]|uniref:XRE family transcriptional regulator n=1 Tax=Streptomyces sp. McG3 TaxID=2725483 RepID=UPI001BE94C76|nr:XRE family transcriptional regulator [Streptomyces sp. McG3]MBT2897206.1 XRE family transcriptional regulator [Streptomyces sp. McG3]